MNAPHESPSYDEADPFDLPEWLGECDVTWEADGRPQVAHALEITPPS